MSINNKFVAQDDYIKSFYDNLGEYISPKNINEIHFKGEKIRYLLIDSAKLINFRNKIPIVIENNESKIDNYQEDENNLLSIKNH